MSPDPPPKDRRIARADDLQEWSGPACRPSPTTTSPSRRTAQKEVSAGGPRAGGAPSIAGRTRLRHLPRGRDAGRCRCRICPAAQDVHRLERGSRQYRSRSGRNTPAALGPGTRARRIIGLLQEVFEASYTFDLGEIVKKGLKDTARKLRLQGGRNDYAVAWVVQRTLGGHAIPLDEPTRACCRGRRRGGGPREPRGDTRPQSSTSSPRPAGPSSPTS